jgi:AcrR family transcriptional regulator
MGKIVKKDFIQEKKYHHGNLKKELITSAQEILIKDGHRNLSLRKVAKKAGVSPAAVYRHYPDLESLLSEVAVEGFRILQNRIEVAIKKKPKNFIWQFRESGIVYVEFALEYTELFRVMYGNFIEAHSEHVRLKNAGQECFSVLVTILKNAQKKHLVQKSDPNEQALAAWALVHGVSTLIVEKQIHLDTMSRAKLRKTVKNVIKYLHQGIGRP